MTGAPSRARLRPGRRSGLGMAQTSTLCKIGPGHPGRSDPSPSVAQWGIIRALLRRASPGRGMRKVLARRRGNQVQGTLAFFRSDPSSDTSGQARSNGGKRIVPRTALLRSSRRAADSFRERGMGLPGQTKCSQGGGNTSFEVIKTRGRLI